MWDQVTSDPYRELPHYRVTSASFLGFLVNHLLQDSNRTLDTRVDLKSSSRKLLHPNGICMAGTWNITATTPYTGYFATGSTAVILARASTALTATTRGRYRAFGFAGKLYPTDDFDHLTPLPTANFFTIEDLGGTLRPYFLDAENTNDIIHITIRPSSIFQGLIGTIVANTFLLADRTWNIAQTLIRQLYPIAELGETHPTNAVAPRWIKIVGSPQTPRIDAEDFRDELSIANYPDGIVFDIYVADEGTRLGSKTWLRIGDIQITDTVASYSCDHRLHFAHPRFRG